MQPNEVSMFAGAPPDADILEAEARCPDDHAMAGQRLQFDRVRQDRRWYYRLLISGRPGGSLTDAKHARQTIAYWRDRGWLIAELES